MDRLPKLPDHRQAIPADGNGDHARVAGGKYSPALYSVLHTDNRSSQDLPHFQDDVFPVKRNGLLRQPNVKVSLDRARVRLEVAESY